MSIVSASMWGINERKRNKIPNATCLQRILALTLREKRNWQQSVYGLGWGSETSGCGKGE
jgi:hypothetical protein